MQIKGMLAVLMAASFILSPVVRAASTVEQSKATQKTNAPAKKIRIDLSELKSQAFAGNAQAQFTLAKMYEEGRGGLPKSLAHAVSWYEEAARNGLAVATKKLAALSKSQGE